MAFCRQAQPQRGPILMFVSLPQYRYSVPAALGAPGAQYWRVLGMSLIAAWYVLSVRMDEEDSPLSTMLMCSDRDLRQALEKLEGTVESLICMAPSEGSPGSWDAREIAEVWRATDPAEPDGVAVVLVGLDGVAYSGMFGEIYRGPTLQALIARVV